MSKVVIPSQHYFFSSADQIRRICESLFAQARISFFDYARFYKDNSFLGLSVNSDSLRIFFELEYEPLKFYRNSTLLDNQFYYHFSTPGHYDHNHSQIMKAVYKITKSDHGFIITKKQDSYAECYFFSSPSHNQLAINHYLNQLPLLTQFIEHFQKEAGPIINKANENQIILPSYMMPKLWDSSSSNTKGHCHNKSLLTHREIECANFLCKGYTTKEIASELNLSLRTVETYLNNIKDKINIRKKSDIIKYMLDNPEVLILL